MLFRQISIIGVGLLGGSLGLAVKEGSLTETVVGIGHRVSTLEKALRRGAVDRYTLDPAEGVAGADLVVLATPVGLFGPLIEQAAPRLEQGCLITDVGSTKRAVAEAVLPHVPPRCRFVGSHPLAGSEARGIDSAAKDFYNEALVLVVPPEASDEEAVARIENFWRALGADTRRVDAATHDRLLAQSSHLPHLVASALIQALGSEAESLVGNGFLDTTRIASGDPGMWRDIFQTNRDELLAAAEGFQTVVEEWTAALRRNDNETIQNLLKSAKERRDRLLSDR